ncbi:glycosyltransferase [Desulfococcaceae bacterium HSG7]|nr:glycosyltransferase [Desulfococcaceae bacterium HSG7]
MKIVQISTSDIRGGAARAAYRLHKGLLQSGVQCRMLVKFKDTSDEFIDCAIPESNHKKTEADALFNLAVQEQYIGANRTDISNTLFSHPYSGYDLSDHPFIQDADIINLHWINHFQSLLTLKKLFKLRKPIVWTMHDQWAFTGGCHYSSGCEKYRQNCIECPQLTKDPFRLAEVIFKDKLEFLQNDNLTIVTPSNWLADCIKNSRIFKNSRVEVIPNALETDIFKPLDKTKAKNKIGLKKETITLLFCADIVDEKRKGFATFIAAIKRCMANRDFKKLVNEDKIKLVCLGSMESISDFTDIPFYSIGHIDSDKEINMIYNAADIFILPSLEDNLPNTVLEAMSCGVPVVAFDIGGLPDMIEDGVTGRLAPAGDEGQLSEMILALIFNAQLRETMSHACRQTAVSRYALEIQANRYLNLYKNLKMERLIESPSKNESISNKNSNFKSAQTSDVSLGLDQYPNFKLIHEFVILEAVKEYSLTIKILRKQNEECEADRALRLYDINRLLKQNEALHKQNEECEADRALRLDDINRLLKQNEALHKQNEECEADRALRLKDIYTLHDAIAKFRAENAENQETIRLLQRRLDETKIEIFEKSEQIKNLASG